MPDVALRVSQGGETLHHGNSNLLGQVCAEKPPYSVLFEPLELFQLRQHSRWEDIENFADAGIRDIARAKRSGRQFALVDTCTILLLAAEAAFHNGAERRALDHLKIVERELRGVRDESFAWVRKEILSLRGYIEGTSQYDPEDGFWKKSFNPDPEVRSIASRYIKLCKETGADSALFIQHGEIIAEYCAPWFVPPVPMMSSTKSLAGIAAFMLKERRMLDLDAKVSSIMKDWSDWQEAPKNQITVRHLLTHTSGLPGNKFCAEHGIQNQFGHSSDVNEGARRLNPIPEYLPPGSIFDYSNPGTQLLAAILSRAARMPIHDFLQRELLEPLGMKETSFYCPNGPAGLPLLHAEMQSTPRNFARLGKLILDGGGWGDRQILKPESIQEMLSSPRDVVPGAARDYGHLWWRDPRGTSVSTIGYLDNNMELLPQENIILVRTQRRPPADNTYAGKLKTLLAEFKKS